MYRVWTKDSNGSYTIMTDWMTRGKCVKFIIGRWDHWPPFAYVSQAETTDSFTRYNGE